MSNTTNLKRRLTFLRNKSKGDEQSVMYPIESRYSTNEKWYILRQAMMEIDYDKSYAMPRSLHALMKAKSLIPNSVF